MEIREVQNPKSGLYLSLWFGFFDATISVYTGKKLVSSIKDK